MNNLYTPLEEEEEIAQQLVPYSPPPERPQVEEPVEPVIYEDRLDGLDDFVAKYSDMDEETAITKGGRVADIVTIVNAYTSGGLYDVDKQDILKTLKNLQNDTGTPDDTMLDILIDIPAQIVAGTVDASRAFLDLIGLDKEMISESPEAKSLVGNVVRQIAQSAFGMATLAIGGTAVGIGTASTILGGLALEGVSSFIFKDGSEGRLSDVIEDLDDDSIAKKALSNALTSYLATDPEDTKAFNRMKQALDDVYSTVLIGGATATIAKAVQAGSRVAKYITARQQAEIPLQEYTPYNEQKLLSSPQKKLNPDDANKIYHHVDKDPKAYGTTMEEILSAPYKYHVTLDRIKNDTILKGLNEGTIYAGGRSIGADALNVWKVLTSELKDDLMAHQGVMSNADITTFFDKITEWKDVAEKVSKIGGLSNLGTQTASYYVGSGIRTPEQFLKSMDGKTQREIVQYLRDSWTLNDAVDRVVGTNIKATQVNELKAMAKQPLVEVPAMKDTIKRTDIPEDTLDGLKKALKDASTSPEKKAKLVTRISEMLEHEKDIGVISKVLEYERLNTREKTKGTMRRLAQAFMFSGLKTQMINLTSGFGMSIGYRPLELISQGAIRLMRNSVGNLTTDTGARVRDILPYTRAYVGSISDSMMYAVRSQARHISAGNSIPEKFKAPITALKDTAEYWRSKKFNKSNTELNDSPAYFNTKNPNPSLLDTVCYGANRFSNAVFGVMQSVDDLIQSASFKAEMEVSLARSNRIGATLEGEYLSRMERLANQRATEATFQQEITEEFAKATLNVHKYIGNNVDSFFGVPFSTYLAPVVKTPLNILTWKLERIPGANFLLKKTQDAWRAGGVEREEVMAKMGIGFATIIAGLVGASMGHITGGGIGENTTRAKRKIDAGIEPYSIVIDGQSYSYKNLPIVNELMSIPVSAYELFERIGQRDMEDSEEGAGLMLLWADAVGSLVTALMDSGNATVGFGQYMDLLDSARTGDYTKALKVFNTSVANQITPNIIAEQLRNNFIETKQQADTLLETIYRRWGIDTGKDMLDIFGNPIPKNETWGFGILSSSYRNIHDTDNVYSKMIQVGAYIQNPRRVIQGVQLNDTEYREFMKILKDSGIQQQMESIFNTMDYKQYPGLVKQNITNMYRWRVHWARNQLLAQNPELNIKVQQARRERQLNKLYMPPQPEDKFFN